MKTRRFSIGWLMVWLTFYALPGTASGQLNEDMKQIFQEMIPQLDGDLKQKLEQALKQERDYIELNADQFKQFRDHPANPFEGWNGIDPDSIKGTIRLQFETQPIRSRKAGPWERQSDSILSRFQARVLPTAQSTVRITDGKTQVALGMFVSEEGHVITKLSEVVDRPQLFCKTTDGRRYLASLLAKDKRNDVALLKIEAGRTVPVRFSSEQPAPGSIVLTTDGNSKPFAIGIYSNTPRSLIGKNQAYLGVKPNNNRDGVKIVEITKDSSADQAGLKLGDVITSIDGNPIRTVESLVNSIRGNEPGDQIAINYLRNGEQRQTIATLAGRSVGGPTADRFKMMKTFGAIQSKRRDEFPLVFQHDTPLTPEQCGGPIVDSSGRMIGMNIARGGRVATYAIPSAHLKTLVRDMLRPQRCSKRTD